MVVTSTSSASRYCDTIWPKRPKPITSTEPLRAVEIVGLALVRRARGGAAATSVSARERRAEQQRDRGDRRQQAALRWRSGCRAQSPSGSSTKANSPAPVSTEPARSASPRRVQVTRNSAHTMPALSSVMTTRGGDDQPQVRPHDLHVDRHADAHEEQREQQAAERLDVGFELVAEVRIRRAARRRGTRRAPSTCRPSASAARRRARPAAPPRSSPRARRSRRAGGRTD